MEMHASAIRCKVMPTVTIKLNFIALINSSSLGCSAEGCSRALKLVSYELNTFANGCLPLYFDFYMKLSITFSRKNEHKDAYIANCTYALGQQGSIGDNDLFELCHFCSYGLFKHQFV